MILDKEIMYLVGILIFSVAFVILAICYMRDDP